MASTGEAATRGRRPALDGVRGIAILLVVANHSMLDTVGYGGIVGVTLFFVLSGYLITRVLARELEHDDRVDFRRFFTRRAARLLPALSLVVLAAPLYLWAAGDPRLAGYRWHALSTVFYVGDIVRAVGGQLGPLGHTWSLSVEEQFYLLWPLALVFLWRRCSRRSLAAVTVALAVTAIVWRLTAAYWFGYDRVYFAPDTNAFGLLMGCAFALVEPRRASRPLMWLGGVALFAMSVFPDPGLYDPALVEFGAPLAGVAALAVLQGARVETTGPLVHPVLRWLGTVSYGWYLWHEVLMAVYVGGVLWLPPTVRLAMAVLALGIATLSWRYVEQPALRRFAMTSRTQPHQATPMLATSSQRP